MNKKFFAGCIALSATLAFTGCSGNSSEPSPAVGTPGGPQEQPGVVSGQAMNDYLVGARVCVDANFDFACNLNEIQTTTGARGAYTLSSTNNIAPTLVDQSSSDDLLSAPAGSKIVSPITTLVDNQFNTNLANGDGVVRAYNDAINSVKASLAIQTLDPLNDDYVANASFLSEARKVGHVSSVVNQIVKTNRAIVKANSIEASDPNNQAALNRILITEVTEKVSPISRDVGVLVDSGQPVNVVQLASDNDIDAAEISNNLSAKLQKAKEELGKARQALEALNPEEATGATGATGGFSE
ncbi:MAG: hypothetical protein R3296_10225 [Oleiphilaceae bacterium]|nr:hypothetical protein [Oleiphilaceae bacterium]